MVIDPLWIDTFSRDLFGKTPERMAAVIAEGPPWHGWWGKATEGASGFLDGNNDPQRPNWLRDAIAEAIKTDRLGRDWWVGTYHYAIFRQDAVLSAQHYLKVCAASGVDWARGSGFMCPCIDVESGDNAGATRQQVVDHVSKWIEYVRDATGRDVWCYGGSLPRDLGIAGKNGGLPFGADMWEIARYTATLPVDALATLGIAPRRLLAWQYDGDGKGYLAHYPTTSPMGPTDVSAVVVDGGGQNALAYLRAHC